MFFKTLSVPGVYHLAAGFRNRRRRLFHDSALSILIFDGKNIGKNKLSKDKKQHLQS
jgi:hypothetical protein